MHGRVNDLQGSYMKSAAGVWYIAVIWGSAVRKTSLHSVDRSNPINVGHSV